jgi:hypothetical protein
MCSDGMIEAELNVPFIDDPVLDLMDGVCFWTERSEASSESSYGMTHAVKERDEVWRKIVMNNSGLINWQREDLKARW